MKEIDFRFDEFIKLKNKGISKFVYFLMKKNEIVYIGQSKGNLLRRINKHIKTKEFDNVKYLTARTDKELNRIEKQLIQKHKPKLNKIYKNHSSERINEITKIAKRSLKTRVKVQKILEIDKEFSSHSISEIIGVSKRTVERYRCQIMQ